MLSVSEDCVEKRKFHLVVSPDSLQVAAHFKTLNTANGHTTRSVQTHTRLNTLTNLREDSVERRKRSDTPHDSFM